MGYFTNSSIIFLHFEVRIAAVKSKLGCDTLFVVAEENIVSDRFSKGKFIIFSHWFNEGKFTISSDRFNKGKFTISSDWFNKGKFTISSDRFNKGKFTISLDWFNPGKFIFCSDRFSLGKFTISSDGFNKGSLNLSFLQIRSTGVNSPFIRMKKYFPMAGPGFDWQRLGDFKLAARSLFFFEP